MSAHHRRSPTAIILVAAACLGVGALVGGLATSAGAPDGLSPPPTASTMAVTLRPFNDARGVSLTLQQTPGMALSTSRHGIVTATSCVRGGSLKSGDVAWAVAGVGLLALHTAVPLYRDLKVGDTGPDVAGLTAELHRLDSSVPSSATLATVHVAAVDALLPSGQSPPTAGSTISRDRIVWLPQTSTNIASCDAVVGAEVTGSLAVTRPTITGASLAQPPAGLVPGDRVLTVDGTVFPATAHPPSITDPAQLKKLLATPTGSAAAATVGSNTPVPLQASFALADPVQAATVPAAAVIGSANRSCVLDAGGVSHRVRVVDSQLGRSVIQFADGPTPTAVSITPPSNASCS